MGVDWSVTCQNLPHLSDRRKGLANVGVSCHSQSMSATKLQNGEPSPFVRSVADEVNAMLGRHGRMSGQRLSELTGLPYRTLNRCLKGQRPFAVDELEKIATALGCGVTDFMPRARTGEDPTTRRYPADNPVDSAAA